jgi:predicted DNA-binding transcriptional regulator AlpA
MKEDIMTKSRRILRRPAFAEKLGYHPKYIDEIEAKDPTFPRRFRTGGRAVAWFEDEADAWIEACAETRVVLKDRDAA